MNINPKAMFKALNLWLSANPDKVLHAFAGYVIAHLALNVVMQLTTLGDFSFGALGITLVAALVKEIIWDKLIKKGKFSWEDFAFTLGGGIAAMFVSAIHQ